MVFIQPSPVGRRPVYSKFGKNLQNSESLQEIFKIIELTEVLQWCECYEVNDLLSNARIEHIQSYSIRLLESRLAQTQLSNYMQNAPHVFTENENVKRPMSIICSTPESY